MVWRRVARTLLVVAAGLVAGAIVFLVTRPSDDELQRAALDEFGLPPALADSPVAPVLDRIAERIADRALAETRTSALAALGTVAAVTAAGVIVVERVDRRGRDRPSPTNDEN